MRVALLLLLIIGVAGCIPSTQSNTASTQESNQSSTIVDDNVTIIDNEANCTAYDANITQGRALFTQNCVVCHANDGYSGDQDIRGRTAYQIEWAFNGVAQMSGYDFDTLFSDADVIAIESYLAQLQSNPAIVTQTVCSDATSKALLGSTLFVDKNLSLTRTLACSSCHNPSRAFVDGRYHTMNGTHPVNGALSLGDDGVSLGGRNAPTVLYAQFSPTFAQGNDGNYTGGQFHDGRAATLMHQAKGPFLDTAEMMMPSAGAVIERVKANPSYVSQLKTLYGATVLDSNTTAYDAVADAIATFERNAIFAPFDSKYDRFKEGNYTMSTLEAQGYALFFSNALSCKKCHTINSASEKASHELFTNYAYENIGTPRNLVALQARDGNTSHIDLGLGGRSDINDSRHYGKVKVPTLRNIAITAPYMHNGVFQSLEAVLAFYDHRSAQGSHATNPETNASWESADVNATINRTLLEASAPLSDSDIAALVAFLKLLTDARYESLLD